MRDASVGTVQSWLERASWLQWLWSWMGTATAAASAVAAAVTVVLLVSPVMIMIALAVVSVVMTPQMVELVATAVCAPAAQARSRLGGQRVVGTVRNCAGFAGLVAVSAPVASATLCAGAATADWGLADLPAHDL